MGRSILVVAAGIFAGTLTLNPMAPAETNSPRKATERVAPDYPEIAKHMHIEGSVKIEIVVRPNGSVKSTRVLGGSPVLVRSAVEAVLKWKFEASPNETTETVVFTFPGQ